MPVHTREGRISPRNSSLGRLENSGVGQLHRDKAGSSALNLICVTQPVEGAFARPQAMPA
jgi:hypothetical protein